MALVLNAFMSGHPWSFASHRVQLTEPLTFGISCYNIDKNNSGPAMFVSSISIPAAGKILV